MHLQLETGQMFGLSELAQKNQHQHNKLYKPSQVINSRENATGYMSSLPAEIST